MKKEFTLSIIVSLTFLSLGFLLLHYHLIGYGLSFFVFLPFILGFLMGKSTVKTWSLYGLIFSIALFIVLLLAGGLEGMVCVLMALPIVLMAVALGVAIKYFYRKYRKSQEGNTLVKSSIIPFLLFLTFAFTEKELSNNQKKLIAVKSVIVFNKEPLEVYEAIKSVDTVIAKKTFLMKLNLPVPRKCVLKQERVGGIRICYFDGGKIVERITALEPGKTLTMDVIDYQLTGRKWLGFKDANYYFEDTGNGSCKMTRITTYTSQLYPRLYWEPLEAIGIKQEHEYVFNHLKGYLKSKLNSAIIHTIQ